MNDLFKLKGVITLIKFDKNGNIVKEWRHSNLIVNTGLERAAKLLIGLETTPFQYIAIGSSSTAPSNGDTTLGNEVDRVLAGASYESPFKAKLTGIFTFNSSVTIREAGIFDSLSGGTLLSRVTFSDKNFTAGESVGIIWTIELSRS